MTAITAEMVKVLREKTGAGIMDVKNALNETQGDMEKATELLRQKGIASAEKKSGRATLEGVVAAKLSADELSGVLVEVNSETDFVARNEQFVQLADTLAGHALATSKTEMADVLAEPLNSNASLTVEQTVKEAIGVIKENLSFRRFIKLSTSAGLVKSYIHTGGKIGVLLALETPLAGAAKNEALQQLAKDLTLHVASAAPDFVQTSEIPADVVEEEKRIEMGKEDLASKPVEIREKIVEGRVQKLMAQRVLYEQPFVKDPGKTVSQLVAEVAKQLGTEITVSKFVRFVLGEELAGEAQNAEELAAV